MSCKLASEKENLVEQGNGSRSRLPVFCTINESKRKREDELPEMCPHQKWEDEGSLLPPPSTGPRSKKRKSITHRGAATLRSTSKLVVGRQQLRVDPKAGRPPSSKFSAGSRRDLSIKTSSSLSRPLGNQNTMIAKPGPLSNVKNLVPEKPAENEKGKAVHSILKKKRPGWDTKGRLEDLEAYIRSLPDIGELQKKLEVLTSENLQLETQSQNYSKRTSQLECELATEKLHHKQSELIRNMYESELQQVRDELSKVRIEHQKYQDELAICKKKLEKVQNEVKILEVDKENILLECSAKDKTITDMKGQLLCEESKRRDLHEQLQEVKGNIRVFCRVRPFTAGEIQEGEDCFDIPHIKVPNDKCIQITTETGSLIGAKTAKFNRFQFDQVFGPLSSQSDIFEELSQLVQSALDGINVCIFAYGQTGSGKTFTMEGDTSASETLGVIPRSVKYIFQECDRMQSLGWSYTIQVSYLEIYNEKIQDLLAPSWNTTTKYELRHIDNETYVTNLTKEVIQTEEHLLSLVKLAQKHRAVAETECNEYSSRSHSVFILKLNGINTDLNKTCSGILNLVDLAGSERAKNSGAEGSHLTELKNINSSLTALSNCIMALGNKSSKPSLHIPFRNSKLTHLLQNCLGGNCKTLMFINVSPIQQHAQESLNSLRFAEKVNATKIGLAAKNF
ncbi:unnamed protein product [Darwinula stevensoni]|uniref:Kinesin motor domain-containing protein n=1 Tax=Darwinula stevensoni TaxID=69355 RepID=A0A7R9ABB8_9CRUS|nr:unnamed protein product [Darwinula stevensoni]CAG0899272.1 unnamed protein product [Darwinula stevensoni]